MHGMEHVKYKFVVILIREDEHRTDRGKDVMFQETGSYDVRILQKDEEKEAESIVKDVLQKSIRQRDCLMQTGV